MSALYSHSGAPCLASFARRGDFLAFVPPPAWAVPAPDTRPAQSAPACPAAQCAPCHLCRAPACIPRPASSLPAWRSPSPKPVTLQRIKVRAWLGREPRAPLHLSSGAARLPARPPETPASTPLHLAPAISARPSTAAATQYPAWDRVRFSYQAADSGKDDAAPKACVPRCVRQLDAKKAAGEIRAHRRAGPSAEAAFVFPETRKIEGCRSYKR